MYGTPTLTNKKTKCVVEEDVFNLRYPDVA